MKKSRKRSYLCGAAVAILGCMSSPALAQGAGNNVSETAEAPRSGLEDIVVTAQKKNRAEKLQDVPVAITALGPTQLEQARFKDLTDIAIRAPGVALEENGGTRGIASFNIRGLGTNSSSPATEPAVGTFVDGVYLGTNIGVTLDTFDLEGIEILRGPQGTLQGRNVTGGAILIRTRRPSDTLSIRGQASIETGPEYNIAGSVEGPLSTGVRAKVAGYYRKDDGWFNNPTLGRDMGRQTSWFVRPMIVLEPWSNVEQTIIYERGRTRGDGGVFQRLALAADSGSLGFQNLQDNPGFTSTDYDAITSDTAINVGFGNGVITNIFGYRNVRNEWQADFDGGPGALFTNTDFMRQHQFSEEIRYAGSFGKLDLTVGGYFFQQHYFYLENRVLLAGAINRTYGGTIDQRAFGVFAQGEYHFSDTLSLTLGGRYTTERKRAELYLQPSVGNVSSCDYATKTCGVGGPPVYRDSDTWPTFTPKFSLNYKPEAGVLVYASVSRGIRNGGYNVRQAANRASLPGVVPVVPANTMPASNPRYDIEDQWAYEVGFKSDLLNRKLRLNGSVFLNTLKGLQRDSIVGDPAFGTIALIANATDATVYGFDAEMVLLPVEGLQLDANVGYVDTDYKNVRFDLTGDGKIDAADYRLKPPRSARWSYNIGGTYTYELANGTKVAANANYAFRSAAPSSDDNVRYLTSRRLLTASLTVTLPDSRFEISLYGKNLLNDSNEGFVLNLPAPFGFTVRALDEGRVIGVAGKFKL
ncbi:TonB-dependent receptor [Sphingobium sp. TA15]|uniref:TonB-dependent receptor-like protein n=1 Tax=Sphingobium indicum (strain DSM 16413 / CCM 7287 / MTCC 6362 / UT26 / NBRC 101211 / UT26S) TaxID=452662 RepID=D4Z0V4_SPHIU|nr:TonB-dependent receptor [Sphingobium indicum]BAI96236.1 TonB-dependent receptor-like protein [Sphingobium indicum UT26S]BDD65537.1 TonB-dependent receptor [Sphingobium sp. TA15]